MIEKMLHILTLCRVLLIAGVQTLTIDSQLGTSIEDCFERISIGEHVPADAIYRNVSELTNRECEQICKQDKQCQAYDYGVGAKGNATCNLSTLDEKTIKEQNPLKRHPDYDVYIRRFQCEQSPPTPIQPLSDDPGPQHRPVFRPEVDERPSAEDYLISGDLGYGKPQDSYRPDDINNSKPDFDIGPSYGDHKPLDIPLRPGRPQDPYRPERPDYPYRPERPNDSNRPIDTYRPTEPPYGSNRPEVPPYGPQRPQDGYGSNRPQNLEPNDELQFQGIKKPPPLADDYSRPNLEKPNYHYIVRPTRKPRPQNDYPQYSDLYGLPSGPVGPPDRPYKPTRPNDKPAYSYNGQYASNYGQNTQNDNSLYVEIHDPPRPYIPIKDRPNQQYDLGHLGYGTYSSQNSYFQTQNNEYASSVTEIGGYGHNKPNGNQKPDYNKPEFDVRPQKPGYGTTANNNYGTAQRPHGNQGGYGSNQNGFGNTQDSYGGDQSNFGSQQAFYNTNKGSYNSNTGSYNSQSDLGSGQYGETGYGSQTQRPNDYRRPSTNYQGYNNNQNTYKGSYSSSFNEQNSHQSSYNSHDSYETNNPTYNNPHTPQKPYDKPYNNPDSYGSNQSGYDSSQNGYGSNEGGYGGNKGSYSSTQSSHASNSNYASNQGNYGTSHANNQEYGHNGNLPGQSYGGGGTYGNNQGYGSNQGNYGSSQGGSSHTGYGGNKGGYGGSHNSYGGSQGGYGLSGSNSYGSGQSYGESQYADQSTYSGYGNQPVYEQKPGYGNTRPDYGNRPDYDYDRPGHGQKPSYVSKPSNDETGYGQKPSYESHTPSYGSTSGNNPKPYNNPRPSYNDPKPSYNDPRPTYSSPKPSYNDPKPGYNDPKPVYNDPNPDSDKPDPPYQSDVKPVYEYDLDKPNNVPAYIARPGGEIVTSQPVVVGDYGRPAYKEPGIPRRDVSHKACFRRVLAGQRALRSFVRRVVACERLEDCRRECAEEKRFHCESFNYRLDPSFRGKGLCELMTKPIEAFDIRRDFVQDKDYDFFEIDRNSLEPNCPETLRGPGLLHSGFLSSKDRIDDRNRLDNRPNRIDGWRDRNDWVGGRGDGSYQGGYRAGNRRNEERYVPYQIGIGRSDDNQGKWGQYGGVYGGSQYYKNRNEFHKSISHWGLTSERPTYGVKPYYDQRNDQRNYHDKDRNDFDYNSLGKNLRKYFQSTSKDDSNDFGFSSTGHRDYNMHDRIDHGSDRHGFDYHGKPGPHSGSEDDFDHLGREDGNDDASGEDYYGVGKSLHRYGYGAWKRGRWNTSGVTNGIGEEYSSKAYYEASDRSDESPAKDCFSRRRPGMSLSSGAVRRSLITRSVLACEAACFGEKEFKCVSYSYRYSNSRGSDNCFLSERPFHGLDLSTDSGSDVYAMPQDQACSTISHTPWIESECFYHVRSDTAVSGSAVQSALTVAGLGACEAECIRARGFFCRGFSFRFDSPAIGDELHNCILTSSSTTSLSGGNARRSGGHELYARGNYGRGCEPHTDTKDNGECYLQYDKAAKLTPSAIRGHARVKDEQSCSNACTTAPFRCLSFSYNNNASPDTDNCLLSEIRLFDLQKDVDYVHSGDDWLFAFDLFNSNCWRKIHSEEPSSEIPHPIHVSAEEDYPSGPTGTGYLPDTSGPTGPPSGPPDTPYLPSSGPPSGPGYHPHPPEEFIKPHHPSIITPSKPYPIDFSYKPDTYPSFKPGYGPPAHKPEESYRPQQPYKPEESYRPQQSYKPVEFYRPHQSHKPEESYRPQQSYKPVESYRPQQSYKPDEYYGPPYRQEEPFRPGSESNTPSYRPETPLRPPEREVYQHFRPDLPGPFRPGFKPSASYPDKAGSGFRPGSGSFQPGYGDRTDYLPDRRPSERPQRPGSQGSQEVPWRHYTVSGFPCRTSTTCAQNVIVGHWACEPEGGEIGSWDYCCSPTHRCGYSEGFNKPWCYVGPKEDQWRPCSEKYYPYHQHNVPHPSSQGHREDRPPNRPWHSPPRENPRPPVPGPYRPPPDQRYWDNLYQDGPTAYYDQYGNPLPGFTRVPTENRPHIRNRYNPSRPSSGNWVQMSHEEPTGVPGSLGAPRYWPVAYLHKDPPPNTTYFRYNETRPTTTTEKNDRTTTFQPLSRELPAESRNHDKPDDLDAKSTRDDKKINVSKTDEMHILDFDNDTMLNTTTEIPAEIPVKVPEIESMKTEHYRDLDKIDGIDDKLHDFSKSIEVFDIEDAKDDKASDLKMLEAEEKQIEAIGRLLAARRGSKLVIENRSQKDLDTKNIAVDKDLVEFNFGNRFPTPERRGERRGVIRRISKDEIERDRNMDRSLEVSETTFVRPPRVLSTTENIRKAIVNGKVFYDATIREPRDVLSNSTQKHKILRHDETNINFREQRDDYLNFTRKPKHFNETPSTVTNLQNSNRKKNIRLEDFNLSNTKNLREERDTRQNNTRKIKRRQDDISTSFVSSSSLRELYNSSRKAKSLRRLEEASTPSVISNNNFGKRKTLTARNVNPVRRVRRVYRKKYNPEEVRKRLLERERNKNSTEFSKII